MATQTEIFNAALRRLGVEKITSPSDNNKRATVLSDIYEVVRDELLEAGFWNFSMKRASLTVNVTAPLFGWERAFDLPADYIRMYKVSSSQFRGTTGHLPEFFPSSFSPEPNFAIEDDKLLTDLTDVYCIYSARITDTTKFSSGFTKALYLKLAAEASYSLTQDKGLGESLTNESIAWLEQVRSRDAMSDNDPDDQMEFTGFIAPRFK